MKVSEGSVGVPAPEGTHVARCFAVLDLGTQTSEWMGEQVHRRKVLLGFELPTETHTFDEKEGPRPFSVWRRFTASLHPKGQLKPTLEAWRGRAFTKEELKEFEMKGLLGAPGMLTVTHNEKGYGDMAALVKLPKGMKCPKAVNPTKYFSLEPEEFDTKVYSSLSDRLKDTIAKSPEYRALFSNNKGGESDPSHAPDGEAPPDGEEDDVPF
jgi:hypothetical protein